MYMHIPHDSTSISFSPNKNLARDFLSDPLFLAVGRVGSTTNNITQNIQWVEERDKEAALFDLLRNAGQTTILL